MNSIPKFVLPNKFNIRNNQLDNFYMSLIILTTWFLNEQLFGRDVRQVQVGQGPPEPPKLLSH